MIYKKLFARRNDLRKQFLILLGFIILQAALLPLSAAAGTNSYLLESPTPAQAQAACLRYGFQMVRSLSGDVYLVQISDAVSPDLLKQLVKDDPDVKNLELDGTAWVPEATWQYRPGPAFSYSAVTQKPISDYNLTQLYGQRTWVGYVQQPALAVIESSSGRDYTDIFSYGCDKSTSAGIVAVIDTGVDPDQPLLRSVLIPGYDFTRGIAGRASEMSDLSQSTAAILEQSTAAILEQTKVAFLNQSTAAILEQSTAAILEGQKLPAYFGHGTMVAGLVHLVAPTAKIMPLKAFNADGSAKNSNILQAIYYATDHGANVINMSFSLAQFSDELMRAVNYATRHGVICVASAGNDNRKVLVYPAAFGNVVGVGSTTLDDHRSAFSNYGADLVTVAAPGEALVTTYPGNHYAMAWGTSFSSGLVSGAAALLVSSNTGLQVGDVKRAFSNAVPCASSPTSPCAPGDLGYGRLDLNAAQRAIVEIILPTTTPAPR
ncbi:MAG: hypothetical protein DMG28_17445 [Acidobacteria bacterium]|nr:MAG: hypothetical protein DMG28_17445 [Acidobacteriota bacterium]